MKTLLPHNSVVESQDDVSPRTLNDMMLRALASSRDHPCSLELFDDARQRFLFFRDGQIYAAGLIENNRFDNSTIRDFLLAPNHMNFPTLVWYDLDSKTLHSTLILFQKKPGLRVQSPLVDLDELLDKLEAGRKSCVVSAVGDDFLAVLKYEKGKPSAEWHGESRSRPRETSPRETFLVEVYTVTAENAVTINVYEDLLVSYAPDTKTIPDSFNGRFDELFLSKPPMVSLRFREKEIEHFVFDKTSLKIGRTTDNDIVIDNLAVSRLHAVLEADKGSYFIRDCDSLNGTVLNGNKVGRARLEDGDEVSIGKHTIVFRRQGGRELPARDTIEGFDQTMVIEAGEEPVPHAPSPGEHERRPKLIMKTEWGDRVIDIGADALTIGKGTAADIAIDGAFVAKRHAEIVRDNDRVVIRHLGGLRKVTVGGKSVREAELSDNDEIKIANEEFIFQE